VEVSSIGSVADRSEIPSDCRCERSAKWSCLSRANAPGHPDDERLLVVSLRGQPANLAFVDARHLTLIGTVEIGGATVEEHCRDIPATFGDLAVMSPDGRFVYATFDSGANGAGGVAVVDVRRRRR
jgi:hypothetical protein